MAEYAFEKGEDVLCEYGGGILLYEAKIERINYGQTENDTKYFVHYKGWNKRHDEWLTAAVIYKINEENLARQKLLVQELHNRKVIKKKTEKCQDTISKVSASQGQDEKSSRNKRKFDSSESVGTSSTRSTFITAASTESLLRNSPSFEKEGNLKQPDEDSASDGDDNPAQPAIKKARKDVTLKIEKLGVVDVEGAVTNEEKVHSLNLDATDKDAVDLKVGGETCNIQEKIMQDEDDEDVIIEKEVIRKIAPKQKEAIPLVPRNGVKPRPVGRPKGSKTVSDTNLGGNTRDTNLGGNTRVRTHWKQLMEERIVDSAEYERQIQQQTNAQVQAFPLAQRIRLTDSLKSCLNHDEEMVEEHKKLAKLPPEKSVRQIVEDYCQFRSNKASSEDRKARVAKFAAHLIKSFNAYAPLLLLFQFEKLQFIEATTEYPNLELSDLYGFPHLLRFLAILDCVACTVSKSLCKDQEFSVNVHDFIRYLSRNTNVLFHTSLYIDKPPRYHRMAYF